MTDISVYGVSFPTHSRLYQKAPNLVLCISYLHNPYSIKKELSWRKNGQNYLGHLNCKTVHGWAFVYSVKQMPEQSCKLRHSSATLPNEWTAEAARSSHKMPNNGSVKKGQELMFLSYLEGSVHAERSPEDWRSGQGVSSPYKISSEP